MNPKTHMPHPLCYAALLCAGGIMLTACSNNASPQPTFVAPTQPSQRPSRPGSVVREIAFGQSIADTIVASNLPCTISEVSKEAVGMGGFDTPCRHFVVVPPENGTLVVELTWDIEAAEMLLLLKLGDIEFAPAKPRWSPLISRAIVTGGQSYAVTVGAVAVAYGLDYYGGIFRLTTRMEK